MAKAKSIATVIVTAKVVINHDDTTYQPGESFEIPQSALQQLLDVGAVEATGQPSGDDLAE